MGVDYEACLVTLQTQSPGNPNNTQGPPLFSPPPSGSALFRWPISQGQALHNNHRYGEKLLDGDYIGISFKSPVNLHSHIQLSVSSPSQHLGQDGPMTVTRKVSSAVIKLSRQACKRLEFHEVDRTSYENITGQRITASNENLYLLSIDCDSSKLSADRLFVESCPGSLRSLRDTLRYDTQFGIFIRSQTDLRNAFSSLISAFAKEARSGPNVEQLNFLNVYLYDLRRRRLQSKDVPSISGESRLSFFDMDDYIATFGIGAMIESILTDRETIPEFKTEIVLFGREKGGRKKFNCAFKVPPKFQDNLNPGDKASAILSTKPHIDLLAENNSDSESDSSDEYEDTSKSRKRSRGPWDLQVLTPVPNSPPRVAWAMIERQWDDRHDRFCDNADYQLSSLGTSTKSHYPSKSIISSLLKNTKIHATIIPEDRHSIFVYVFEAMTKLKICTEQHLIGDVEKLLLGSRLDELTLVDIYASLSDRSLASEDDMELNESQKDGIRSGRHAPAGLVSIHGGPGTGKTHFIIQAVSPFLRDTTKRHRVLLTAASNVSVDSMAEDLQNQLEKIVAGGEQEDLWQYIIRLHSIKTEKSIALREAKQARQENREARKARAAEAVVNKLEQTSLGEDAAAILAHCQTFSERRYEEVRDERVRCIKLSAGELALQIAGIHNGSVQSESDKFATFVKQYERYSKGDNFSSEDWTKFELALEELLAHTIANASAVCATVGGAADSFFAQQYATAELLIVDEAARIPEYQMWPLLVFFPHIVGKILVGDPKQLPPAIKRDERSEQSKRLTNPVGEQVLMSFQQRMQSLGLKTTFFDKQYRAVSPIAAIYSNVCYEGKLGDGRPEELSNMKLAKDVIEHNRRTYGVAEPVVFYTVEKAEQGRSDRGSRFCQKYILLVLCILQDLFDADFATSEKPCTIAVLTPYKEEKRLLQASIVNMEKKYPQAGKIELHAVDSVQGLEFDIVVADPVVVKSPGFLDENRLNVMFSRASFGLYIVGDSQAWSNMSKDDSKPLRRFKAQFLQYKKHFDAGKQLKSEFFDKRF